MIVNSSLHVNTAILELELSNSDDSAILVTNKLKKLFRIMMLRLPQNKHSRLAIRRRNTHCLATTVLPTRPHMCELLLTREVHFPDDKMEIYEGENRCQRQTSRNVENGNSRCPAFLDIN